MAETKPNPSRHRRRGLPRFGIRSRLLLMTIVAVLFMAFPWMEDVGVIAYCDHYDLGKTTSFHVPAIGSASCARCQACKTIDFASLGYAVSQLPNRAKIASRRHGNLESPPPR
jgi:hypothetical protein